jgi:hypothetical protein
MAKKLGPVARTGTKLSEKKPASPSTPLSNDDAWRGKGVGRVLMINDQTAEGLALLYKRVAIECAEGAKRMLPMSTPQFILVFHALELALKSWLASNNVHKKKWVFVKSSGRFSG